MLRLRGLGNPVLETIVGQDPGNNLRLVGQVLPQRNLSHEPKQGILRLASRVVAIVARADPAQRVPLKAAEVRVAPDRDNC